MGSQPSKEITKTENNQLTINKNVYETEINYISETVNNTVRNFINNNSSYVSANNYVELSNLNIQGDIIINTTQNNISYVTLTAELIDEMINDVSVTLGANLTDTVVNNANSEILSDMVTNAESNQTSGFLNIIPEGTTDKETLTAVNTTTQNIEYVQLAQTISNMIYTTYEYNNISSCIVTALSNNSFIMDNISGGSFTLNLQQSNTLDIAQKCLSNSNIISEIANNINSVVGVSVSSSTDTKQETAGSTSAIYDTESKDLGDILGEDVIGNATTGVGNVITSAWSGISNMLQSGGLYVSIFIAVCICCVLLITVGAIAFILTSEQGGKNIAQIADVATSLMPQTAAVKAVNSIKI